MKSLVTYKLGKHTYSVYRCTFDDIPIHLKYVKPYWESTNTYIPQQIARMEAAVSEGCAYYMLIDNDSLGAFFYYEKVQGLCVVIAIWAHSYRELYLGVGYMKYYKSLNVVRYIPHSSDNIPYQKMVTSVQQYVNGTRICSANLNLPKHTRQLKRIYNKAEIIEG